MHLLNERKINHIKRFNLDRNNIYENAFTYVNTKIK